jgi:DNA-binding transcriptional regulator LsrR (DeoR family)
MVIDQEQHRLLYRIAQAYYIEGLTQQQIGKQFGLSRVKVSRLLKQAREERIVNITLVPPSGRLPELERSLERKYGLDEVIIVTVSAPDEPAVVARELGPATAEYLLRILNGDEVVGITWGTTTLAIADALPTRSWPNLTVVQILGGLGPVDTLEHSTELARRIAQKLKARLQLLPAPGIASNRAAAEALRSDHQIARTLALAARADVALVGLGVPLPQAVLVRSGTIINREDLESLKQAGAVGDIALRFIDKRGRPLKLEIDERIIGLTLEQIRKIPRVIATAGGEEKYCMILASLRSKILNVLVTDQVTGEKLLAEKVK